VAHGLRQPGLITNPRFTLFFLNTHIQSNFTNPAMTRNNGNLILPNGDDRLILASLNHQLAHGSDSTFVISENLLLSALLGLTIYSSDGLLTKSTDENWNRTSTSPSGCSIDNTPGESVTVTRSRVGLSIRNSFGDMSMKSKIDLHHVISEAIWI
jgi:hypothetical protein